MHPCGAHPTRSPHAGRSLERIGRGGRAGMVPWHSHADRGSVIRPGAFCGSSVKSSWGRTRRTACTSRPLARHRRLVSAARATISACWHRSAARSSPGRHAQAAAPRAPRHTFDPSHAGDCAAPATSSLRECEGRRHGREAQAAAWFAETRDAARVVISSRRARLDRICARLRQDQQAPAEFHPPRPRNRSATAPRSSSGPGARLSRADVRRPTTFHRAGRCGEAPRGCSLTERSEHSAFWSLCAALATLPFARGPAGCPRRAARRPYRRGRDPAGITAWAAKGARHPSGCARRHDGAMR